MSTEIIQLPSYDQFRKLPKEEQRSLLIELRKVYPTKDIREAWKLYSNSFYDLIRELNIPRITATERLNATNVQKAAQTTEEAEKAKVAEQAGVAERLSETPTQAINNGSTHQPSDEADFTPVLKEIVESRKNLPDGKAMMEQEDLPYTQVLHLNGTHSGRALLNKLTKMMALIDDSPKFKVNINIVEIAE